MKKGFEMKKITALLIILIIAVIPVTALGAMPLAGDKAPDFSLKSMNGDEVSLSDFKGNVVLIGMFHICVPKLKHLG